MDAQKWLPATAGSKVLWPGGNGRAAILRYVLKSTRRLTWKIGFQCAIKNSSSESTTPSVGPTSISVANSASRLANGSLAIVS